MAEMVVGEKVTLEEMGGARMHATISGCGDQLAADDIEAIEQAKQYFSYLPQNWRSPLPNYDSVEPARRFSDDLVPAQESAGYDIRTVVEAIVDDGSFFEVKPLFAPELVTGFALAGWGSNRHRGKSAGRQGRSVVRRLGRQGCALHLAVRRVQHLAALLRRRTGIHDRQCCGAARHHPARREDDHRSGRGYRADGLVDHSQGVRGGLYAMGGPGFGPDACLALPTAKIAVMGPEAAINAVYANKIAEISDEAERTAYVERLRTEYELDIDILRLASELVVDGDRGAAQRTPRVDRPLCRRRHQGPALLHPAARRTAGVASASTVRARCARREWRDVGNARSRARRRAYACPYTSSTRGGSKRDARAPQIKAAACGTVGAARAAGPTSRRAAVLAPRQLALALDARR